MTVAVEKAIANSSMAEKCPRKVSDAPDRKTLRSEEGLQ